ncbi:putative fis-like DNA-binding protein [Burkholderiales bacterium GJ-E10]|nr:putative fis-like DNA-binding protein [Burkholderiales bacterium GJ-E10]
MPTDRADPTPSLPRKTGEDGAALDHARGIGETIEQCVFRNLEEYLASLDGASPHALHEMVLRAVEQPLLRFALARCAGNQSAAAELLGINRNTLRRKLHDFDVR